MDTRRHSNPRETALKALLVLVLALIATDAWAAVLYRMTDPAGRVTYSDSVPQGFNGNVRRLDVDTGEHTVTLPKQPPATGAVVDRESIIKRRPAESRSDERIRQARARRDAARQALEDARNNSTAEDWIYFGSRNPSGMRRAPRPEYQARLEELERNALLADEQLRAAERG